MLDRDLAALYRVGRGWDRTDPGVSFRSGLACAFAPAWVLDWTEVRAHYP